MMLGRERELAAAREVLRAADSGRGSVLVVLGEPGIGKTTLLAAAADSDPGLHVVRVAGVQAEQAVAFATLQALLWPLRDQLDELETGQSHLLRSILQLGPAVEGSTFAIGAATLALLSESSREQLLVVAVDDAQWADEPSQEVLCFVGRRLDQERIALLAGVREDEPCLLFDEASFPRLRLEGLPRDAARSLLDSSAGDGLPESVGDGLVEMCAGNPLGLVELPRLLTDAQRCGEDPLPPALDAGPLVQRAFNARVERLSQDAQTALLLLAAAGQADRALLERAGAAPGAIDEAEEVALVEREGRLDFRHPLLRAAVYGAASPSRRRSTHRMLADAVDGVRRTWHLAGAAAGPDESVAKALEAAAADPRYAGGLAAVAQALERAAELTLDDEQKAGRLLAAARAWRRAGRIEHGRTLLSHAFSLAATVPTRARIQLERGSMLVRQGEIDAPCELLLTEAELAEPTEPKLAAQMLAEAAIALDAKPDIDQALALAKRACSLAGADGDRPELEAENALLTVRTSTGLPPTEDDLSLALRAAALLETPELRMGSEEVHWVAYCLALHERDQNARRLSDRSLAESRTNGDVWSLCYGLYARAAIEQTTGRIDVAHGWASEAVPLSEQIGEPWRIAEAYGVLAETEFGRGNAAGVEQALESKERHFRPIRPDLNDLYRCTAVGTALVACARYDEATQLLERAARYVAIVVARTWYQLTPLELAEAYACAGRRKEAEAKVREVAAQIESSPLVRPAAKLARVRGLLVPEAKIDSAFAEALALLERAPHLLEQARVELCWGERLRRAGRSADAVVQLEHALARFDALGAVGWTERTRGELEAASGSTRPVQPRRTDVLTAQELRVAGHAAAGMRDREIAALLYLSPRTVESYLHSAYRKLGVSNRTQLAGVLASDGFQAIGAVTKPVPQDP